MALCADVFEEGADVDGVLRSQLLQHAVQDDVGACASHPGTVDADSQPRPLKPDTNTPSYLQWTSRGPAASVRAREDLRMKLSSARGESGTPLSGHWVYWYWVSVRSGLCPF